MKMTEKQRQGYAKRVERCLVAPAIIDGPPGRPESVNEARAILDGDGWTANDTAFVGKDNTDWLVACHRGADWMFAHGQTQLAAWRQAVERAKQRDPANRTESVWGSSRSL